MPASGRGCMAGTDRSVLSIRGSAPTPPTPSDRSQRHARAFHSEPGHGPTNRGLWERVELSGASESRRAYTSNAMGGTGVSGWKVTRGGSVEYRLTVRGTRKTAMIARPDGTVVSFR